jgi:hypothetical protein
MDPVEIGDTIEGAVGSIIEMLKDESSHVRYCGASALGMLAEQGELYPSAART